MGVNFMEVYHFGGKTDCNNIEELISVLKCRHGNDRNEFELYINSTEKYPFMTVLAVNELACVHYFRDEADCGNYAYSDEDSLGIDEDGYTTFYSGLPTSETEVSNKLVIPFSLALVAAQDFFLYQKMSEKLNWFEL
jgi:hypothetical protein